MEQQLSLHLKNFNNRIKVMNQSNSKELVLSALEARNLHNDIFELLAQIAKLTEIEKEEVATSVVNVVSDGGKF
jgi:hypothetical protein